MNDTEAKIEELEKKVNNLEKQTIWTFGGSAVFLALFNSFLLGQSPKIARIFDDLLDGEPLPGVTELFVGNGFIIMISTFIIPFLVVIFCWKVRKYTFAVLGTLIFSLFVEMAFILSAILLPFVNLITSM